MNGTSKNPSEPRTPGPAAVPPGGGGPAGAALRAARFLEFSLLLTFVVHALAMASMALCLLPGMPGGGNDAVADRAQFVAAHPWVWRGGWFFWQLTALSDVLLGLALLRTAWVPRLPAIVTLLITLASIVPDQVGQALWITRGVTLAQSAVASGDFSAYAAFEARTFFMIAGVATTGYVLGALGWTWCFVAARTWRRRLKWLSAATWTLFGFAAISALLPPRIHPGAAAVSAANAVAFILLMVWLTEVSQLVWARSRPLAQHGRYAAWRLPRRGVVPRACEWLASHHLARAAEECVPVPSLSSDITDVVYVNYLVDAGRLERYVPPGLQLQRLGPGGNWALFTFLTYNHGHFGPTRLGPFRRLLPSPVQSNWRIHVIHPRSGTRGISFLSTAISSAPHALTARLLSEGVPMHVPERAEVRRDQDGTMHLLLDPASGSAPDLRATLNPTDDRTLPPPWTECFKDFDEFLTYCVPQDRALSTQPWYGRLTRQEIHLGIPLDSCEPLTGVVESRAASAIAGDDARPVCFRVAKVKFVLHAERRDAI